MLRHLRNVPIQITPGLVADFVLGPKACAVFISLRYHLLYPHYLIQRIKVMSPSAFYRRRIYGMCAGFQVSISERVAWCKCGARSRASIPYSGHCCLVICRAGTIEAFHPACTTMSRRRRRQRDSFARDQQNGGIK